MNTNPIFGFDEAQHAREAARAAALVDYPPDWDAPPTEAEMDRMFEAEMRDRGITPDDLRAADLEFEDRADYHGRLGL